MDGMASPILRGEKQEHNETFEDDQKREHGERRKRLLYEFNLLPAAYAHSSWIESICSNNRSSNAFEQQSDHTRCIDQSAELLQHHGLCDKFDWSVRAASVRMALMQRTAFMRMCTLLGLMGAGPRMRRTIDGKTLRSLDATFGDLFEAIWTPEALVLSRAGAEHNLFKHAEQERLEQTRLVGYKVYKALLYAESEASPESISRALFRLPMSVAVEPSVSIDTAVVKPVMRWMCRSAVKRWEPSWAWLF